MAKKFLLVLVLAAIVAGGVFAQESWGGKKNLVAANVGVLVGGASYERILTPNLSVGAIFYWANSFILWNELEVGVFGRYYIWKGLYGELGLGYHTHSEVGTLTEKETGVKYDDMVVLYEGFGITPGLGYKFDPGAPGGFFLEPGIKIPITIGKTSGTPLLFSNQLEGEPGVGVGFLIYLGLGWAF